MLINGRLKRVKNKLRFEKAYDTFFMFLYCCVTKFFFKNMNILKHKVELYFSEYLKKTFFVIKTKTHTILKN